MVAMGYLGTQPAFRTLDTSAQGNGKKEKAKSKALTVVHGAISFGTAQRGMFAVNSIRNLTDQNREVVP